MFSEQLLRAQGDRIRLRWTTESDLDAVLRLEQDEENRAYIIPWTYEQHQAACSNPDLVHCVIETKQESALIGFLLLAGRESVHQSVEFRRVVIAEKGKGYGKEVLKLVKQLVFEQWKAHRLWLDVFDYNHRARHVYASEGFVEEGVLRECVVRGEHFASLVIMSLLAQEYFHAQSPSLSQDPHDMTITGSLMTSKIQNKMHSPERSWSSWRSGCQRRALARASGRKARCYHEWHSFPFVASNIRMKA